MIKKLLLPILVSGILFNACKSNSQNNGEDPLAKVGTNYLYPSELPSALTSNIKPIDSAQFQKKFVDNWVKKQLLLEQAEQNLSESDKDVSKQLEEYRSSLLIYKYQQMLLKQKLDTVITRDQVEKYYSGHNSGFVLNKPALRGIFIQLPRPSPDIDRVRSWCRSEDPEIQKSLENLCSQNARKYEFFINKWTSFETIQKYFPVKSGIGDWILRAYKVYETQDTSFTYLLSIRDYRLAGTPTPVDIVEDNIRSIILNKRKIDLLNQIENDIFNSAVSTSQVELFNK
jgi:hypothetical protein